MKTCLRYILILAVTLSGLTLPAAAAQKREASDTVYIYQSWRQVFNLTPGVMLIDPYIYGDSQFSVNIYFEDEAVSDVLREKGFVALSIGDSIWFTNSTYLKGKFKGDTGGLDGLLPLFYNTKVAYVACLGNPSVKDVFFARDEDITYPIDYYYIDFKNSEVRKVTHDYLSELLVEYHDLKMRYEGMKDYKKRYVIEDYFFKYVDRATGDFMHPYILELVE